jgi:hypothetical protein
MNENDDEEKRSRRRWFRDPHLIAEVVFTLAVFFYSVFRR